MPFHCNAECPVVMQLRCLAPAADAAPSNDYLLEVPVAEADSHLVVSFANAARCPVDMGLCRLSPAADATPADNYISVVLLVEAVTICRCGQAPCVYGTSLRLPPTAANATPADDSFSASSW